MDIKENINSNKRVLIGMSGGVDSTVAAALLLDRGYDVAGVTMRLIDGGDEGAGAAAKAASKLGIDHNIIDVRGDFKGQVIDNFSGEYKRGLTPNPCVICNEHIKFGVMFKYMRERGFDYIATGHYAVIEEDGGIYRLRKSLDAAKDQTYFLYRLTQDVLSRSLFPLGAYSKSEIRRIAKGLGLENADRKDSQDICFVDDGDYAGFLVRECGAGEEPGDFVDTAGHKIGTHRGLIHYTIGQRRGLGQAFGERLYVIEKDAAGNTVTLGANELLYSKSLLVRDVRLCHGEAAGLPARASVKIRYSHAGADAALEPVKADGPDDVRVVFDEPQRAITPGQSAVFCVGDEVIGGGIIA